MKFILYIASLLLVLNLNEAINFAESVVSSGFFFFSQSGVIGSIISGASQLLDVFTLKCWWVIRNWWTISYLLNVCGVILLVAGVWRFFYLVLQAPAYKSLFGTAGGEFDPDITNNYIDRLNEMKFTGIDNQIPFSVPCKVRGKKYQPYLVVDDNPSAEKLDRMNRERDRIIAEEYPAYDFFNLPPRELDKIIKRLKNMPEFMKLIDRRPDKSKRIEEIMCPQPTYLRVHQENKYGLGRVFIIVDEVFWHAYHLITRFVKAKEMNEDALDRIRQRMALLRGEFNLAADEEPVFVNSINHAFLCYQAYYRDHIMDEEYSEKFAIWMGFETKVYPRFYRRLFKRAVSSEDVRKMNNCLKMLGLSVGILSFNWFASKLLYDKYLVEKPIDFKKLKACFGYVWHQIPERLQKKKYELEGAFKRLKRVGDETVGKVAFSFLSYFNPRPDIKNIDNLIDGREARLNVKNSNGVKIGNPSRDTLRELEQVVELDLLNWKRIVVGDSKEWLDSRKNYSLAKKEKIQRLIDAPHGTPQDTMFIKWESYDSFKAPRIISNSDKREVAMEGPVITALEEQFENLSSILSGKAVNDWGRIVSDSLCPYEMDDNWNILVTDHSSFENSVSPKIKNAVENKIYDYVLKDYPALAQHLKERQGKRRYIKYLKRRDNGKEIKIVYDYKNRFSGDARTYQANSLTNHYLIKCLQHHFHFTSPYFVSGDDGLMAVPKNISIQELKTFFAELGFDTKLEPTTVCKSGFCGFNFDPENENRRLCQDVMSTIIEFFTSKENYNLSSYRNYLYDKAICMLHEYQADPTLRPALQYILSRKRHYLIGKYRRDWWDIYLTSQDNSSIQDLLESPVSSFQTAAEIHHNQLTPAEEEVLSQLFLRKVQELFESTEPSYLEDFIWNLDIVKSEPRYLFNDLNKAEAEDGLYFWKRAAFEKLFE